MDKNDKSIKHFLIITSLVCVAIFLVVFLIVFSSFDTKKTEIKETSIELEELTQKEIRAVILDVDLLKDKIKIYDLKNETIIEEMKLITETKYIDSSNILLSPSELEIGTIADIIYTEKSLAISQIKVSKDGWTKENVSSFKMDYIENKMTVDKKIYKFSDDVVIHYQGKEVSYKELGENVVVTLKGYENVIWSIEINEYLGNIRLIYSDLLEGADVEIDSDRLVKIKEVEDIYLTVGEHKLVIKKADIDPIVITVDVKEKDVTEVDLGEVDTKKSLVTFNVNVEDFYVDVKKDDGMIDATYTNNLLDSSNALPLYYNQTELPFGNYVMTFRKKGYNTITREISISTTNKKLNVTLKSDGTTIKTTITTVPNDAEIYINGKYQGTGKVSTYLYKGANTVRVTKAGYTPIERDLNIETSKEYTFNLVATNIYENVEEENNNENTDVSQDIYNRK